MIFCRLKQDGAKTSGDSAEFQKAIRGFLADMDIDSDSKTTETSPPSGEHGLTIVMDITGSYTSWKDRTRDAAAMLTSGYSDFRVIGMNDNCGSVGCQGCETCKNSIVVHPWRTSVEQLQKDFDGMTCRGGGDAPEKPACVLRWLVKEQDGKKHSLQKHTVLMFFDQVGHGCTSSGDSYSKQGCASPSECGCHGDVVQQSLALANRGVRICIVAPNRTLESKEFVVYASLITRLTPGGWLMALPDDRDSLQKSVLAQMQNDTELVRQMKALATAETDRKALVELAAAVAKFTTGEVKGSDLDAVDKVLDKLPIAQLFAKTAVVVPGLVHVARFGEDAVFACIKASQVVQRSNDPSALRDAIQTFAKTVQVSVVEPNGNPTIQQKMQFVSIEDRCEERYRRRGHPASRPSGSQTPAKPSLSAEACRLLALEVQIGSILQCR